MKKFDIIANLGLVERQSGIFVITSPIKGDINGLETLLKDHDTKFVLLDDRTHYDSGGDEIIMNNISIIEPWYKKLKGVISKDDSIQVGLFARKQSARRLNGKHVFSSKRMVI